MRNESPLHKVWQPWSFNLWMIIKPQSSKSMFRYGSDYFAIFEAQTKWVGDNFEVLVTILTTLVASTSYLFTLMVPMFKRSLLQWRTISKCMENLLFQIVFPKIYEFARLCRSKLCHQHPKDQQVNNIKISRTTQ